MSEDLISREKAYKVLSEYYHHKTEMQHKALQEALDRVPSAEPEEFEWCTGCKEYDQEAHCCHRWTKVIRETVEELKSAQPERKKGRWKGEGLGDYRCSLCGEVTRHFRTNYCPNCGADMRGEDE